MQLFIDSAEYLFATTHGQIVLALLVLFLASLIITTYNLFFHPLAKFPGPKVAAATGLYEFWYDVVRQGQYVYKIEQMHCDYGPIVRINPDELSIRDAEYWDKLYAPGKRMNIPTRFAKIFPLKGSMLFTPSHEIHKARRKAVEPFFSRQNIARIEPMIVEQATILDERLRQISGSGKVVTLEHAIFAFASDVVGRICCETSTIPHLLQEKDFAPQWYGLFINGARSLMPFMHLPFLVSILHKLSPLLALYVWPVGVTFQAYMKGVTHHIVQAKEENLSADSVIANPRSSVFRYIISTADLLKEDKSVERLGHEAATLLGAGAFTLSRSLAITLFHILANDRIRKTLSAELAMVMADFPNSMPRWSELSKLPYLHACIKEGLRLSYLQVTAMPRCLPDIALEYDQYTIPKSTPIRMSIYLMHTDPETFIEPHSYVPERWLGQYSKQMDRQFVAFSKGSRNCPGHNLAWAESYIVLSILFRRGAPDMRLFDTGVDDVRHANHCVFPIPKDHAKGVRVTVE